MTAILIKYLLPIGAVLVLMFGVFEVGHANGHTSGYDEAWAAQQKTIQSMVDKQNAATSVQNQHVTDVEQSAVVAQGKEFAATAKAELTRQQVVTQYQNVNVKTASTCGWGLTAVDTINTLIDADPANAASGVAP